MISSPVKVYALQENMAIYQPEKVRGNETFIEQMRSLHPDFICVVAYGKILPKEILELVEKRKKTREEKNWKLSDNLRDEIIKLGYNIKDTKDGMEISKI